jgi:hypothetical protein
VLDPDDEQVIKECQEAGGILVTWDRVVLEASGGLTPYQALDHAKEHPIEEAGATEEAQAELTRLRQLTPVQLTVMADGADETVNYFKEHIHLTEEGAAMIRRLRVEREYSWRAVARFSSWESSAPPRANQLAGMVICEKAASLLSEDYLAPPWN